MTEVKSKGDGLIYILLLDDYNVYIGMTRRSIAERYEEHLSGMGSKWTKIHRPMCLSKQHSGKSNNKYNYSLSDKDFFNKNIKRIFQLMDSLLPLL
jgi:hypothetical protein